MRMRQAAGTLFLVLAAVACAPLPAAGSLQAGPEIPVSTTALRGANPAVARGADGAFIVLWSEGGTLVSRRFAADGSPDGPVATLFRPTQDGLGGSELESWDIAALPAGGHVAVWGIRVSAELGFSHQLRLRRLDDFGQPAGPEQGGPQGIAPYSAAVDRSGGITVLAYVGSLSVAQRFSADGAASGSPVFVMQDSVPYSAAVLPDGGFVVARADRSGEAWRITARLLDPEGTPRGPAIPVGTTAAEPDGRLLVAAGPEGHFSVAWIDGGVKARLYDPEGEPIGSEVLVGAAPAGTELFVRRVDVRSNGAFLVFWARGTELLARAFDPQAQPIGVGVLLGASAEPGWFAVDAVPTPTGWIAAGVVTRQGRAGAGPWLRFLTVPCAGLATSGLCLNGDRFHAAVRWRVPATGAEGAGAPIPQTADSGAFWFFDPANHELNVKVLDGRGVNGHFWVFYGSMTDVEFDLTVTDSRTGEQRTYHNPAGTMASRADTAAF